MRSRCHLRQDYEKLGLETTKIGLCGVRMNCALECNAEAKGRLL